MITRAFLAFPLSDAAQIALGRMSEDIAVQYAGKGVRGVKEGNFHITLHFFGPLSEDEKIAADEALNEACAKIHPFFIALGEIGGFPSLASPKVVYCGLSAGVSEASAVRDAVALALERKGFHTEERQWTPHITLARMKPGETRIVLGRGVGKGVRETISRIHLMRSDSTPFGPKYSAVSEYYFTL